MKNRDAQRSRASGVAAARGRFLAGADPGRQGGERQRGQCPQLSAARGCIAPPALAWLDRAFVAGRLPHADVVLRGPIRHFPFRDGSGLFLARCAFDGMTLDYSEGWPRVENLAAQAEFRNEGHDRALLSGQDRRHPGRLGRCALRRFQNRRTANSCRRERRCGGRPGNSCGRRRWTRWPSMLFQASRPEGRCNRKWTCSCRSRISCIDAYWCTATCRA